MTHHETGEMEDYLVPGRDCGECMVCCIEPAIEGHGLDKPARVACAHCSSGGCAIYVDRPPVCREYHCLWRRLPFLDDAWRPDRSGVMIDSSADSAGTPNNYAVQLMIAGGADVLKTERFAGLVAGFVSSGTGVFLNVPAGPGEPARVARLHDWVIDPIRRRDLPGVIERIGACHAMIVAADLPSMPTTGPGTAPPAAG